VLSIISTPIGNLKDITLRSLETLREADIILCEDTRRTMILVSHFGLKARLQRYNEHSETSIASALELLRTGKHVALVSDGGTPCISDPGWKLVRLARESGIKIQSLPGPSALITAAAGSGLPVDSFVFLGFLPRSRSKIRKTLSAAISLRKTVIIYESPYRIQELLQLLNEQFADISTVVLAKEISKIHEEFMSGTPANLLAILAGHPPKGEMVLMLGPVHKNTNENTDQVD